MIYIDTKNYVKLWEIKDIPNTKFKEIRISTSENDTTGKTSYSVWYATCVGNALKALENIKAGDRIVLTKCGISNKSYFKDGKSNRAFKFLVFNLEKADNIEKTKDVDDKSEINPCENISKYYNDVPF